MTPTTQAPIVSVAPDGLGRVSIAVACTVPGGILVTPASLDPGHAVQVATELRQAAAACPGLVTRVAVERRAKYAAN